MATPTSLPSSFSAGNVLTASQMNNLRGAFRVLQVVTGSTSTAASNTTNTLADTGLSATITPQSTSSKVLVFVHHNGMYKNANNAGNGILTAILRGSTVLTYPSTGVGWTGTALQMISSDSASYLDSPATTSAVTYKTQFANVINISGVSIQASVGVGTATSYITLMEISA